MSQKLIFRADGNSTIGLGHMYRIFSLIEMTIKNFEILFVTKENSTFSIIPKEFKCLKLPENISIKDEPDWLINKFPVDENIIILDGYQFDSNYQKKIKEIGYKFIYIDDFAKDTMYANIVINHSLNIVEGSYKKSENVKFALGNKYALLRSSFLKLTNLERNIDEIDEAFVCFGGADPSNLTTKTVRALLKCNNILKINVVLGGANNGSKILELEKKKSSKLKVFKNLNQNDLIKVMQNSNLGIVPSSTILYELCCVRMPIMSGYFIDNQKDIYYGFLKNNVIYGLGDISKFDEYDFSKHLKLMFKQKDILNQMKQQKHLFDSLIPERFIKLINELC